VAPPRHRPRRHRRRASDPQRGHVDSAARSINNRNKTWTPETRPADWKQQLNRWERFHYVRVAVIIAAFALLVAALA
jgi:hypothetical protein